MAKFKKKKLPCVRKLFSTTKAKMTSAFPRTVANTSSVISTVRNIEADGENWPYCARRFSNASTSPRLVAFSLSNPVQLDECGFPDFHMNETAVGIPGECVADNTEVCMVLPPLSSVRKQLCIPRAAEPSARPTVTVSCSFTVQRAVRGPQVFILSGNRAFIGCLFNAARSDVDDCFISVHPGLLKIVRRPALVLSSMFCISVITAQFAA